MFIDINAWAGMWPGKPNIPSQIKPIQTLLSQYGIEYIFMASLDAPWSGSPHLSNSIIYETEQYDHISPVPVIDPTLPTWPIELDKAGVKIIKLLPNYCCFKLKEADELFEEASLKGIIVMVQVRMEDPRRHHTLARVPDVPIKDIMDVAESYPKLKIILGGVNTPSCFNLIPQLRAKPDIYLDTSQLDGMDSIKMLVEKGLESQLLFGSHAPMFMPAAGIARVLNDLPDEIAMAIMRDNAAKLLNI